MPGFDKIYVPGEIEDETLQQRTKEGLNIEDATWDALQQAASDLKVATPAL
jgi:LDH2 family malate/lactate/ureidoglycolate dehydrogenase